MKQVIGIEIQPYFQLVFDQAEAQAAQLQKHKHHFSQLVCLWFHQL